MSWLYSQVLVEEFLEENSWDGEPYAELNVMPTQHKFLRNDKMMEFLNLSQFGLTLQVLTESRGQELLTWYLAVSHAKTLAQQEKAQELQVKEVDYGQSSPELLARLDPDTLLWKTAQCSLFVDLELSYQTFPRWGSMRNGACYLRQMLAQSTRENVYGYLPNNETFFHTPTTGTSGGSNSRKALAKRQLKHPTPCASTGGGNAGGSGAMATAKENGTYIPHSINPNQYEWLMGWVIGWTDLKPLEMDKCHYAQQPPSPYLKKD